MDINRLVQLLATTLDGQQHDAAEKELKKIHKIIGFVPQLLQIAMNEETPSPVRLAAVVYFKNEVLNSWAPQPEKILSPADFVIHNQDKELVRNLIIDVIAAVPENIQVTLAVALKTIVKLDFPDPWSGIVEKIALLIQSNDPNQIAGGLVAFHALVKPFEYRNADMKASVVEAMKLLNPLMYQLMIKLLADPSEQSVKMQKSILKSYYCLTQHSLPSVFFNQQEFTDWMQVMVQVLDRPLPESVATVDPDDRRDLCWFKNKKWAIHFVVKMFDRFGTPKTVQKPYKQFAKWFLNTFSVGLLNVIMKMLEQHSNTGILIPRIVQECINFLNNAVEYPQTWKVMKLHISFLIEKVIFPLMCFTDEDEELWTTDPQEYCRRKFDFFEEYISPVASAQSFLNLICKVRKDMLTNTVGFAVQILSSQNSTPREKDGALQMLGVISELLFKKEKYRVEMNNMLINIVFPFFGSDQPFLRARAAFVLHYFADFQFENDQILFQATELLKTALLNETELPVKLQAAISLKNFLTEFEKIRVLFEPILHTIFVQYLDLIRDLYNDEVVTALQYLINIYGEKVIPISYQVCEHLVQTFLTIINNPEEYDENSFSAMGILDALDSVLMYNEKKEILIKLEPVALQAVSAVLTNQMDDLYSETFNIVTTLTSNYVSPDSWKIYEFIYTLVKTEDGREFFSDVAPSLHNFVVVEPEVFISNEQRVSAFIEMCELMLDLSCSEETQLFALKLLECFVSQFRETGAKYIPKIIEICVKTMISKSQNPEPFARKIIILCAAYYETGPEFLFQILDQLNFLCPGTDLKSWFFEQWLESLDLFVGIHDRKVVLLAFSKMLLSIRTHTPPYVINNLQSIFPNILKMFLKLKEAYKYKAKLESGELTDDEADESESEGEIDDDDDGEDHDEQAIQNGNEMNLEDALNSDGFSDVSDDEDAFISDEDDEFDTYETRLDKENAEDEYIFFRQTLEHLQSSDPEVYTQVTCKLDEQQVAILKDVFTLAEQRKHAKDSKQIEQAGGYNFANQAVPNSFNFGVPPQ